MSIYLTQKTPNIIRRLAGICGQLLLLLALLCQLPAHAAIEDAASISAALSGDNVDNAEALDEDNAEPAPATSDSIAETPEALEPSPEPTPPPIISGESTNNAQIETTPTPQKDNDIRQRITGIFSEIDGLQAVNVSVTQGVVTLTGETPNEKKAQQAINLTNRLTDVVTVEDRINRTLDVQDNVTTVYQGLKAQVTNLVKAVPLLLVGIVLFGLVTWFGSWLSNRKNMWQRLTPNPFVAELLAQTIKVIFIIFGLILALSLICLLYTSPSPRDRTRSRMPSSA